MSNLAKAILIINAKKKASKNCPECGTTMKNGKCPECDSEEMTENAKKGGKSKGWSEAARKKAAMVRKRMTDSNKVERNARKKVAKAAKAGAKPKSSAYGKKLSASAWKYEDKAGDSGSHADYQRAAKAHAAAAKHFKKAGDKKKAAYHERRFKKYNGQGSKYRGTSDGYGGTY